MNKVCGIYVIKCLTNNKVYIGQSVNVKERIKQHKRELVGNYHHNEHLQNAYNKYGSKNFIFKIIEQVNLNELDNREIYWINYYKSTSKKYGFNKTFGGQAYKIYTDEVKIKMSNIRKNSELFRGENLTQSKLRLHEVKQIKLMLVNGYKVRFVADKFNVSVEVVNHIMKGNTWKYVFPELNNKLKLLIRNDMKGENSPTSVLTNKIVYEIKHKLCNGISVKDISVNYKINEKTVCNIKYLHEWSHVAIECNNFLLKSKKLMAKNLDNNTVLYIRSLINSGLSNKNISDKLGIGIGVVKNIKYGKSYKNVI